MIHPRIAVAFPALVRERGDGYFLSRRVSIVSATPAEVTAIVNGTAGYRAQLVAESGLFKANCSCPYAADRGVCKHVWATIRQAEAEGKLDPLMQTVGSGFSFATLAPDETDSDVVLDANLVREMIEPGLSHLNNSAGAPKPPTWESLLDSARRTMSFAAQNDANRSQPKWPTDRRVIYFVEHAAGWEAPGIVVELATEKRGRDGTWGALTQFRIAPETWRAAPDPLDRQIAQMLLGALPSSPYGQPPIPTRFVLPRGAYEATLRLICETGRCRVRMAGRDSTEVSAWDDGPPWSFRLRVTRDGAACVIDAVLRRDGEEMPLATPIMLHSAGVVLANGLLARFDDHGAFALVAAFRATPTVRIDEAELPAFLESLFTLPRPAPVDLPPDTHVTEVRESPQPGIEIHPDPSPWRKTHNRLVPFFMYGAVRVRGETTGAFVFDREGLTVHHRDLARETEFLARIATFGARDEWGAGTPGKSLNIPSAKLSRLVPDLVSAGWRVEANGAVFRVAGRGRAAVRSGVDWFELDAGVRFGDIDVSLHDLLVARRTGATMILLSDGSQGVLPLDWLARLGPIAAGATIVDGALRYSHSQTGLLDALLTTLPEADVDATFERARAELRTFSTVGPVDPPRTFDGTLREYQREGLGWLHFLRKFGLGGCLADDMGLGKTVQVLALLDSRRGTPSKPNRPSIVVVPRSLVFNWRREAERFTPKLRLLDYTGVDRQFEAIDGANVDVVITTYGTLRRDAVRLSTIMFDYAILDEAQAIKTASTASAKAARLLRSDHRLAMTGTPIENRLEELWSLFEFLNPGMLGASSSFATLARLTGADDDTPVGRDVLARALRPVILRRTKDQVARDLPERLEQTLSVELEGPQRKFYDDLLEAYRRSLLERIDRDGIGKARMHILEALLRLRQAACHPALADPTKTDLASAKLDALLPALDEVVAEGHKALVFSQFTSFLALLRTRLDAAEVPYEYLDGRTRDRESRVDRFQNDPTCPLFLISLKAGGHGLNLTAADYVFILDPWWNPAVEAQAIDRAHRIGQTRRVIATRIVARDTIEEKILELQASKRALADAILGQDQGVLAGIGRAELEMLLG